MVESNDRRGDDPGIGEIWSRIHDLGTTTTEFVIGWVRRRNILVQFGIAGTISKLLELPLELVDGISTTAFPVLSTPQILIVLVGVQTSQIALQTRKFNELLQQLSSMDSGIRSDGGKNTAARSSGTSGGGALGGAIAGGAVGASYGPQGIVAGVLVGAIIGDNFEERIDDEPSSVRDSSGRVRER